MNQSAGVLVADSSAEESEHTGGFLVVDDTAGDEDPAGKAGPPCGSNEAKTVIRIIYVVSGGHLRFVCAGQYCCHRHVPEPGDVLPEGASVVSILMEDSRTRTTAEAGGDMQILVKH